MKRQSAEEKVFGAAAPPAAAAEPEAKRMPEVNPKQLLAGDRRLEYMSVSELVPAVRNPKAHAEDQLDRSVGRFGYTEPVLLDERTGRLVAGHGRVGSLLRLKQKGGKPPEGVRVEADQWLVPVVRGWASRSDADAEAYLLASNQLTISGGWNEDELKAMLADLSAADGTEGIGWSEKELDKLLAASSDDAYTAKIETPVYKPTGERPKVGALYDPTKRAELCADIDAAQDITEEERAFLRMAAQRHVVFDYQSIAEYYAHAGAPMQRLMEASALVIIDFKQAIENGFVKLTHSLAEDLAAEEGQPE